MVDFLVTTEYFLWLIFELTKTQTFLDATCGTGEVTTVLGLEQSQTHFH